jgi:IS5 family transposase
LLIVCFLTGLILAVRSARGTTHDFKILKKSKLPINKNARIKVDKGFLGIKQLYPNSEIPHKASKHHPLTREQKQYNRQLAQERIVVEHRNRECKIFRICKEQYRGKHKNYEKTWKLVSAIVNLKLSTRHLKFASS